MWKGWSNLHTSSPLTIASYFLLCTKWVPQNYDVNYPPGNPQIWVSEHAIDPKFSEYVPVYDMTILWKFQFFSFNMEGYGEDLFYPQSLTFDQPLCHNQLQWIGGWLIVGSVLTCPSQKCSGPILPHFCWCQHFFSNFFAKKWKWRLVASDDVIWSEFHETWQNCSFPIYVTCVKTWSHLHTSSQSLVTFFYAWNGSLKIMTSTIPQETPKSGFLRNP